MRVLLLLDQDITYLLLNPLAGKGTKPIEIVSVGSIPVEVEKSFHGAALATYNLLMKKGERIPNSVLFYQIESDITKRIYGGSGALAFAVASMCVMLGRECKKTIGATGVIDTEKGMVEKVEAINEKLLMLIERTPEEVSLVFYPQQNSSEIAPELKRQAKQKGIELKPVQTLDEVYSSLFGRKKRSWFWEALSVLAVSALYLTYALFSHSLAIYLLENEHYSLARRHLHLAGSIAPFNSHLRSIARDFDTPLETQPLFSLRYSTGREETYPVDRVPNEFRLSNRDTFAFKIDPFEPLYVYIVQSEGAGSYRKLYPADGHAKLINTLTTIPGVGVSFRLQGQAGAKDIYIVLSKWRCRILESAFFSFARDFTFPDGMNKYVLEEQCIQLKRLPILLER
ncbi:MAG: hypothetical protein HQK55_02305 [Deltaproteobacteria bacterium]|nr:hypothetical protein [Deltaproteobacteria bacterium]